jgi:hypothetical protein
MTALSRPRTFLTEWFSASGARQSMVVQLTPEGLIRFRTPRKRLWLDFPLARVYHLAALAAAEDLIISRKDRRHP